MAWSAVAGTTVDHAMLSIHLKSPQNRRKYMVNQLYTLKAANHNPYALIAQLSQQDVAGFLAIAMMRALECCSGGCFVP